MFCPNCKSEVPDGSKFCRVCGKPLPQRSAQMGMRSGEADPALDERTLGAYPAPPVTPEPLRRTEKKAEKVRPAASILAAVIVLGVLLLASAGMNAYQYLSGRQAREDSDALSEALAQAELDLDAANQRASEANSARAEAEGDLASTRSELSSAKTALDQANAESAEWQSRAEAAESGLSGQSEKLALYDSIAAYTRGTNPGGSSNIFKVSEPVIVMRTTDAAHTFTLTTDFYAGSIIEMEPSGDAATIAFTESSWGSSTPMTVTPNYVGTTVATFTNDYNSQVFTMLVIVVE